MLGSCSEHQRPFGRSSQHLTAVGRLAAAAQQGLQWQLVLSWLTATTQVGSRCSTVCSQGLVHAEGRGSGCDADAASRARATLLPSSTRAFRSRKHFSHKSHTAPPWSQLQLAWSPALSRSSEVSEESSCPEGRVPWPHAQPPTARAAAPCHSSASLLPAHRKRCAFLSRLRAVAGRGPTRTVSALSAASL